LRTPILLGLLFFAVPTEAAEIYVTRSIWGRHIIHIDGQINSGDEKKLAAINFPDPENTSVRPNGPGGLVEPALLMARTISERGWSTLLIAGDLCASACTYIWLAGKHSVIQRGAFLCFNSPSDTKSRQPMPEIEGLIVEELLHYGLTKQQAWALIRAAPPEDSRCMNLIWGMQLQFHPQTVFAAGGALACRAKFCQAVP
jgi:hypothetical protein